MNPVRKKRLILIGLMVAGVGVAVALLTNVFRQNMMYFFSPSQVMAGEVPVDHPFRIGGMVKEGSFSRDPDGLTVRFLVTDTAKDVEAVYTGILPDLFREGQGVVAMGRMNEEGVFKASEVLAKHDETYMPPEAAEAIKQAGGSLNYGSVGKEQQ